MTFALIRHKHNRKRVWLCEVPWLHAASHTPGIAFFKGRSNISNTTAIAKDRPLSKIQNDE
jgi:hypothetical protein